MDRNIATRLLREELDKHELKDWKIRVFSNPTGALGLCSFKDKAVYLNSLHISTHPDIEIIDTIKHEVAHCLTPNDKNHGDEWKAKAKELGALPQACSSMGLNEAMIDAIRSGHVLEVEVEETVIRTPKYTVHRLQHKCPICNKVAVEKKTWEATDLDGLTHKYVMYECFHIERKQEIRKVDYSKFWSYEGSDDCAHNWDKNECVKCKKHRLFPFQVKGCEAIDLADGRFGVFDEQGLGKTPQCLVWLRSRLDAFPALFVVKSAIQYQWYMAILTWLGDKYIPMVIKSGKSGAMPGLKTYIVSYDMLRRLDASMLKKLNIKTIVLDEVQAIKNPDSARTTEVRDLIREIKHVIPLSGTPWKNRGSEYFVVLNALSPTKFNSYKNFKDRWVDYILDENGKYKEGGIRNIPQFKEYVKDLLIRRERNDVLPELNIKQRTRLHCELDETAKNAYDEEAGNFVKLWNQAVLEGRNPFAVASEAGSDNAIAILQRMRHILGLAKLEATFEQTKAFLENTDKKLIIGVHHIDVARILVKQIQSLNLCPVWYMEGGMDPSSRYDIQTKFNETDKCVLVASTLASGEGSNFQTCADMFIHERQWNPANEEQLEDRICRIGQKAKFLNIVYIHADNSLDTKLDVIVDKKRAQFHNVMNEGDALAWNESSIMQELGQAIADEMNGKNKVLQFALKG